NRVLFFLLLVFTGASLFSFFGFILSELFLGVPLLTQPDLLSNLTDPELLPAMRMMQILQALGMLILPSLFYIWLTTDKLEVRRIFGGPIRQPVLISIVFFMVALPSINYISEWNSGLEIPTFVGEWMKGKELQAGELTKMFLDMPNAGYLVLNLIMIAVFPAVGEELIFRGILQRGIAKATNNPHVAIWVAAIMFSAVHMQFFGFVPRMLMGAAMGYLFYWSGNLWYPIIAHLTNNAMAVGLAYGIQHGSIRPEIESAGIGNGTMAALSVLFCLMLLFLFKKHQESASLAQ
ncbi:MAG: lysostaphin resistance A-like protein, partial [Flavobacteriales bacterium]